MSWKWAAVLVVIGCIAAMALLLAWKHAGGPEWLSSAAFAPIAVAGLSTLALRRRHERRMHGGRMQARQQP